MGKPTKIFIVLLGIMLLFTVISRSAASFTVAQVRIEQPQARKIEHKVTGDGTVKTAGSGSVCPGGYSGGKSECT